MAVTITQGGLSFVVSADTTNFDKQIEEVKQQISNLGKNATNSGNELDGLFKKATVTLGTFLSLRAGTQFVQQMIQVRGQFQQIEIALNTMLGSKEKADKLLAESVKLAATTPFNLEQVASGTKQLLAYGFSAEEVTDKVRRLGDIASGVSAPLGDIVYLYGTLKASGRVTQLDINQFAGRGIPIYEELAKVMGVTTDKVRELVGAGKVGFSQIEQAFNNLTSAGGKFNNLMSEQSKSLTGQISNLEDAWDSMLNALGKQSEGVANTSIQALTSLVENYDKVLGVIGTLTATYGAYRAALLITSAVQSGLSAVEVFQISLWTIKSKLLRILQIEQLRLNAAVLANPYVLAFTALVALVGVMWTFSNSLDEASEAQKQINGYLEENNKKYDELKGKVGAYINVIQDKNATDNQSLEAYRQLRQYLPNLANQYSLTALRSLSAAEAQKILNEETEKVKNQEVIDHYGQLQRELEDTEKKWLKLTIQEKQSASSDALVDKLKSLRLQIEKIKPSVDQATEAIFLLTATKAQKIEYFNGKLKNVQGDIKLINDQLKSNPSTVFFSGLSKQVDDLTGQANILQASLDSLNGVSRDKNGKEVRTISVIDKDIKDLKESQSNSSNNKEFNNYKQQIDKLEAEKRRITGETDKKSTTSFKNQVEDLIKLKEDLTNKKVSILQKLNEHDYSDEQKPIEQIKQSYADLRKELEEFNKSAIKANTKLPKGKQITLFGDATFNRVNKQLSEDIADETNKQSIEKTKNNLDTLKGLYADYEDNKLKLGEEKAKELADKQVDTSKKYIDLIQQQLDTLNNSPTPLTKSQQAYKEELGKQIQEEKQQQVKKNAELLANTLTLNEQLKVAYENYLRDIKGLDAEHNKISEQELLKHKQVREQQYKQEIANIKDQNARGIKEFEALFANLDNIGTKEISKVFDTAKEKLKELEKAGALTPEFIKYIIQQFGQLEDKLKERKYQGLDSIVSSLQSIQQSASTVNSSFGDLIGTIAQLGSSVSNIRKLGDVLNNLNSTSEQKFSAKADLVATAVSSTLNLISIVTNSAKERQKVVEDYYRNAIGFQNEYNLSLNEQIRLQSILNESVFLKDYQGRANDAFKAIADAKISQDKAFAELEKKGAFISGYKKVIDVNNVLKGVGAGAAAGAAIGALAGGVVLSIPAALIGAGIGSVVGGLVGLFGGKKQKEVLEPLLTKYTDLIHINEKGQKELNKQLAQSLINNNQVSEDTKATLQNLLDVQKSIDESKAQLNQVVSDLVGQLGNNLKNNLVEAFRAGEDAGQRMAQSVGDALDNIVQNLLFNQFFAENSKKLEATLQPLIANGDIQGLTDTLGSFLAEAKPKAELYLQSLKALEDAKAKYGLTSSSTASSSSTGTGSQAIAKQLTEQTGSVIAGSLNGIQVSNLQILEQTKQAVIMQRENQKIFQNNVVLFASIEANTKRTADNTNGVGDRLEKIEKAIIDSGNAFTNYARAKGK